MDYQDVDVQEESLLPLVLSTFEYKKQMALFLMKAKEVRKISQSALNGLVDDVTSIVQLILHRLEYEVDAVLKSNGLRISSFDSLIDVFHDPLKTEPFKGLLQKKFYREHMNLLVSYNEVLGFLYIIINHTQAL